MPTTVGGRFGNDAFGVSDDSDRPVAFDHEPPFGCAGEIESVVIRVR